MKVSVRNFGANLSLIPGMIRKFSKSKKCTRLNWSLSSSISVSHNYRIVSALNMRFFVSQCIDYRTVSALNMRLFVNQCLNDRTVSAPSFSSIRVSVDDELLNNNQHISSHLYTSTLALLSIGAMYGSPEHQFSTRKPTLKFGKSQDVPYLVAYSSHPSGVRRPCRQETNQAIWRRRIACS